MKFFQKVTRGINNIIIIRVGNRLQLSIFSKKIQLHLPHILTCASTLSLKITQSFAPHVLPLQTFRIAVNDCNIYIP